MRVLQVPRRFVRDEWGGTETVILETSARLLANGHETEICCPNALAPLREEQFGEVRVNRFPYFYPYLGLSGEAKHALDKKGGNLFSFSLMRYLKRFPDLDLVHLHTQKRLGGIARRVCQKRGIPYVLSLHGGLFDVPTEEAQSMLEPTKGSLEWGKALGYWVGSRRVLDDAAAIICVGQDEAHEVSARFPDKRVVHLPNGVHPERFASGDGPSFRKRFSIPEDAFVIGSVGRIDPQKNQKLSVRALPAIREFAPKAHLVFVGPVTNAAYLESIRQTAEESGVSEHVTIVEGLQADDPALVDAFHASDVFALPSVHEPFGIVILEAWAAGRPVIASRVGGIPSFTEHEKDAWLFESGNVSSFVHGVRQLYLNPETRDGLAERGLAKAIDEYSWDSVTNRLIEIYEEVCHEHSVCH